MSYQQIYGINAAFEYQEWLGHSASRLVDANGERSLWLDSHGRNSSLNTDRIGQLLYS